MAVVARVSAAGEMYTLRFYLVWVCVCVCLWNSRKRHEREVSGAKCMMRIHKDLQGGAETKQTDGDERGAQGAYASPALCTVGSPAHTHASRSEHRCSHEETCQHTATTRRHRVARHSPCLHSSLQATGRPALACYVLVCVCSRLEAQQETAPYVQEGRGGEGGHHQPASQPAAASACFDDKKKKTGNQNGSGVALNSLSWKQQRTTGRTEKESTTSHRVCVYVCVWKRQAALHNHLRVLLLLLDVHAPFPFFCVFDS